MNASASDGQMEVPCCPALASDTVCDGLDFHDRTRHTPHVVAGGRRSVKFRIVAISRRVIDPAADTRVSNNALVGEAEPATT